MTTRAPVAMLKERNAVQNASRYAEKREMTSRTPVAMLEKRELASRTPVAMQRMRRKKKGSQRLVKPENSSRYAPVHAMQKTGRDVEKLKTMERIMSRDAHGLLTNGW